MDKKYDPDLPDLLIDESHPLYKGVMAALEALDAIFHDKISEYNIIDHKLANVLKGFQSSYVANFAETLQYVIKHG